MNEDTGDTATSVVTGLAALGLLVTGETGRQHAATSSARSRSHRAVTNVMTPVAAAMAQAPELAIAFLKITRDFLPGLAPPAAGLNAAPAARPEAAPQATTSSQLAPGATSAPLPGTVRKPVATLKQGLQAPAPTADFLKDS